MITSDTTAVNTGHRNGVVARLQRLFRQKGLDEPQCIGCRHHILDLILRHFLESFFPTESRSPNINYQFVEDVLAGYENLQKSYSGKEKIPRRENPGWRDDFRFRFGHCEAYNFYQKERKWPQLQWHKLPSLHSARWNSRGIFAIFIDYIFSHSEMERSPQNYLS